MANNNNIRPTNKYKGWVEVLSVLLCLGLLSIVIDLSVNKRVEFDNSCPIQTTKPNTLYNCEIISIKLDDNSNFNNLYNVITYKDNKEISVLDNNDKLSPYLDNDNTALPTKINLTLRLSGDPRTGQYIVKGVEVSKINKTVDPSLRSMPFTVLEEVKKNELLLTYPTEIKAPINMATGNYKLTYRLVNNVPEPMQIQNVDTLEIIKL